VDGKYRLGALLGHGGMGWVFEATHLATDKVVALKYLKPRLQLSEEWTQRFAKEARAAGRIDHPNVIRLYDVGGEPPNVYLVMERLRGETLRSRLRRGNLPVELGLDIMLSVMRGVQEAHANGVVHCDLKPENIMLATLSDGTPDTPKVLDFGLSRILNARAVTDVDSGWEPLGAGTPSYMPLEQLQGRVPGPRVDIYAIGVMLYEILAKRRPFEARTREELIVQLATAQAPALGSSAGPGGELGVVVERALRRDPAERFSTLAELERAVREARSAPGLGPPSIGAKSVRKRPMPSSVALFGAFLALMALAAALPIESRELRRVGLARPATSAAVHAPPQPVEPGPTPLLAEGPPPPGLPSSMSRAPRSPAPPARRSAPARKQSAPSASSLVTDELVLRREDF
jgi:serine/threonine-protein kinase